MKACVGLFLVAATMAAGPLLADDIAIPDAVSLHLTSGNSEGQAILHLDDGRCYVILPSHLVCPTCKLAGTLAGGATIETRLLTMLTDDVSIADAAGDVSHCGWVDGRGARFGSLYDADVLVQLITSNGNLEWLKARIEGETPTHYTILMADDERLGEGYSGAAVMANGLIIGQLQSVRDEGRRGQVIRSPHLMRILGTYLDARRGLPDMRSDASAYVMNTSIDPRFIRTGTVAGILSPEADRLLAISCLKEPVVLTIGLNGISRRLSYVNPALGRLMAFPETILVEEQSSPQGDWRKVQQAPVTRYPGEGAGNIDIPAGVLALRITLKFPRGVTDCHIGRLVIE
jgi:hypothetical protein